MELRNSFEWSLKWLELESGVWRDSRRQRLLRWS